MHKNKMWEKAKQRQKIRKGEQAGASVENLPQLDMGKSRDRIAEKLGRSTRTPMEHIHRHNNAVHRSGFCPACKRAGSSYQGKTAEKSRQ